MEHTKGKWTSDKGIKRCIYPDIYTLEGIRGQLITKQIAICQIKQMDYKEAKANAARICACVNACAGMDEPAKIIDGLADALEDAVEALDLWDYSPEKNKTQALAKIKQALKQVKEK